MSAFIYILVVLFCFACRVQPKLPVRETISDSSVKILVNGLPDLEELNTRNSVAKKYGYSYRLVGGCVVSKELADSMLRENLRTYYLLNSRFGPDWRSKFEAAVDSVRNKRW